MSHHLDCEQARRDCRLDITDNYVFRGETGTVFVMDVNSSLAGPGAQPGFHPEARYEFKIHTDGAAAEDLTYRVTFDPRDGAGEQTFALHVLTGPDARDDAAIGDHLAEGRTNSVVSGPDGLRMWAGQALDPFYVDLTQVRAINAAVKNGARVELPGWGPNAAKNSFAGSTVNSLVLEVADQDPRLGTGRHIGVWVTTKLATDAGGWRQINREGHPMVWPIFRPDDSEYAGGANKVHPADEMNGESEHIARLVAGVVATNGTLDDPVAYGKAVAQRLFPDLLPYRTGTPAGFGFAGRNGRTLADNAPEVMFSLVLNSAISTGLTPEQFADTRSSGFPYVVAKPATTG
ncbi:DUF4331 family protein [Streptosporangium sp. 'caverna']|uniref:DUF4331 family protein n=1 Tax=Streptosporangium sp. 'caverna' TaxID=2202249 RepID=UPI000D7D4084|nr:DUF4331 family protein [Streptosporangium sp. 'caverna']AWS40246.1 hypothetical protein DKM19_01745 [Streptosporangium sp. 'caverna']